MPTGEKTGDKTSIAVLMALHIQKINDKCDEDNVYGVERVEAVEAALKAHAKHITDGFSVNDTHWVYYFDDYSLIHIIADPQKIDTQLGTWQAPPRSQQH